MYLEFLSATVNHLLSGPKAGTQDIELGVLEPASAPSNSIPVTPIYQSLRKKKGQVSGFYPL